MIRIMKLYVKPIGLGLKTTAVATSAPDVIGL